MLNLTNSALKALALSLTIATLSACGNFGGSGVRKQSQTDGNSSIRRVDSSTTTTTQEGFNCFQNPNVLPRDNSNLNDTMEFSVCRSVDDDPKISITGVVEGQGRICVFPIEVIDANHVYPKWDSLNGNFLYKCVNSGTQVPGSPGYYQFSKAEVRFDHTNYNAVIISKGYDLSAMQACLNGSTAAFCPEFSSGMLTH